MTTLRRLLPATDHPTQSSKILRDDPQAEGELHHGGQDHQGGDAGQVLDHTIQEGKDRALYFGRFIKHSEIHHQSAQNQKVLCVGICVLLDGEDCGVFWWWGCHSKEEVRFQVVDIASAIRDCASSLSSSDK